MIVRYPKNLSSMKRNFGYKAMRQPSMNFNYNIFGLVNLDIKLLIDLFCN